MESDVFESPYDKKLRKLRKQIEQGQKIEMLAGSEEFQFFINWVRALRDDLGKKIMRGDLLASNMREEDHAKGGYKYLSDVLDYVERMPKVATNSRELLKRLEKEIAEERGDETIEQQ